MLGRRFGWLLALAAIAAIAGAAVSLGATRGGGAGSGARKPARQATVPSVRAVPPTCFMAGQTCSIRPCVEFVARRRQPPLRTPTACDAYPSTKGFAVPIGP